MESEVLDIDDGEIERFEDGHHLPQARRVATREYPLFQPCIDRSGTVAPHAVNEREAVRPQCACDDLTERLVVLDANVLKHSHRDERIAGARDVAVIVQHELHQTIHAFPRRTFPRVCHLLLRDVEGTNLDTVFTRHVQSEGAPPATGLYDLLTRPEHQLAADVIELGSLRLFQRGVRRVVVRARIHHLLVEPQAVEVVAEVVMVLDVSPRSGLGVGTRPGQSAQCGALARDRAGAIRGSIAAREYIDEIAFHVDTPRAERISEPELGTQDHRHQRAPVVKDHASAALARRAVRIFAVP